MSSKIRAAVGNAELPMLRAYRLWFEHVLRCDNCKKVPSAKEGCATGQELWSVYRAARMGRAR